MPEATPTSVKRALRARFALAVAAVVTALLLLEAAAHVFIRYVASPDQFSKYASIRQLRARHGGERLVPHRYLGFVTAPGYVRAPNRHNDLGFRGDDISTPKPSGLFRIVCLGGSTTYCDGVRDPAATYPRLLQDHLRDAGIADVEVINGGVPGYSSLETLVSLQSRILDLKPNLLIVYHAINDVHCRLVWPPSAYRGDQSGVWAAPPGYAMPSLLEYSSAARMLMVAIGVLRPHGDITHAIAPLAETSYAVEFARQARNGTYPSGIFERATAAQMLAANPPRNFERNLRSMTAIARTHGVDIVFCTFASMAQGFTGPEVTSPEYRRALEEHNQLVRRVAAEGGASCVDLAALVPAEARHYTDGIHFSEQGNRVRATLVGEFLAEKLRRTHPGTGTGEARETGR